jgi:ketosteroid isomerase-like protein
MVYRPVPIVILSVGAAILMAGVVPDSADWARTPGTADSAGAVATVDSFHRRMAAADSTGVLALLTRDALILEGGGIETRDEYRAHHLPGDIAFAREVPSSRAVRQVQAGADAAWVTSVSESKGAYKGRQLDLIGAELVVLRRTGAGWRVAAVHWSSRPRSSGH